MAHQQQLPLPTTHPGHRIEADGTYTILNLYRLTAPGGARVTSPRMSAQDARQWRDNAGPAWRLECWTGNRWMKL